MKKSFLLFWAVLLASVLALSASNVSKMYVQRTSGDLSLFFIYSQKMPLTKDSKDKTKALEYDYTYAQVLDSVAMLYTVVLPNPVNDLHASFEYFSSEGSKEVASYNPETIYVKPKGDKFTYRMRIMMSFEDFEALYASELPFNFSLAYSYQGSDHSFSFAYPEKKWIKNRENMAAIIQLIRLNTKKN